MREATLVVDPAFAIADVLEHVVLADDDPQAANTAGQPGRVVPRTVAGALVERERVRATLPPRSWNMLRLRV